MLTFSPKENYDLDAQFKRSDFQKTLIEENKIAIHKLVKVCICCSCFMTIEFVGGYIAGSLAVMTDAAHLLSDLAGFLISMFSLFVATRPANSTLTYGYHRSEVIGALLSILIIWGLTVWLLSEAVYRIFHPQEIKGLIMMAIAACGLMFNIIMSKVLAYNPVPNAMEGKTMAQVKSEMEQDFPQGTNTALLPGAQDNADSSPVIRAAYIHILGDMIQSGGVLLAAIIIFLFQDGHENIRIVDPICTFVFAIIVLCTTIPVSKDCLNVLMEAAPPDINAKALFEELNKIDGVCDVHDIHIWCISIGRPSISMHVLSNKPQKTLELATNVCKKYGIHHVTIQVEDNSQNSRMSYSKCTHEHDNEIH